MLTKSSQIEHRNQFEDDRQRAAVAAFNTRARIKDTVDWERFKPILEEVFGSPRHSGPGRPTWDQMIMFRALMLGVMSSLSDRSRQYMVLDRTSFKPCVGLQSTDHVLAQKTV